MNQPPPIPRELVARPTTLSALAQRYALKLVGPDREIVTFGTLASASSNRAALLTFAKSRAYLATFIESGIAGAVTRAAFEHELPAPASALLTDGDPVDAFYTIFADTVDDGSWESLEPYRGTDTTVARSATIHDGSVICDRCTIMDNVVLMPRTYLSAGVTIQPGAVVGGTGFQVAPIRSVRRVVPHVGGVVIGEEVSIGSQTCIDSGLFGEMTVIGARTAIDNLVHVAHCARIGAECSLIAGSSVGGSARLGDGVTLGPGSVVYSGVSIGDHALVGPGSAVGRDLPAHAIASGNPARIWGWRCVCGERLDVSGAAAICGECGRRFAIRAGHPQAAGADEPSGADPPAVPAAAREG